jgi:hypothetical protein
MHLHSEFSLHIYSTPLLISIITYSQIKNECVTNTYICSFIFW